MLSSTILLSLLPAIFAAPFPTLHPRASSRGFGMIASRSASPIHLQPIHATNLGLYIGLPTSTYCPNPPVPDCSGYSNDTLLICGSQTGNSTGCGMGTAVPGGQNVYIDPTTGEVKYTSPHSASMPDGAIITGFEYTAGKESQGQQELGEFSFCGENAEGFYACPVEGQDGVYQVKVAVKGVETALCLGMGVVTAGSNATAWEYT